VRGLAGAPSPDIPPLPLDDQDEDSVVPPPPPPTPPPVQKTLLIDVRPHHNGELLLSKLAVNSDPEFFGFPFTGRTIPKRVGNAPYPMAEPDPRVEIVVRDASGDVIRRVPHSLNVVYYETKGEIRITIPHFLIEDIPQMSLLSMTRDPEPELDYRLDFYPPECVTPEAEQLRALRTTAMPSGGVPQVRRFGWG